MAGGEVVEAEAEGLRAEGLSGEGERPEATGFSAQGAPPGAPNPSPAIVKKVRKVVETKLDAPELAVALQQLSDFYGPNTLENRRNLRGSIERRSVDVSKRFVGCFQGVMDKLDMVEGHVSNLAECSVRMQQRIKAAHTTTSQVVKITEQLQRKELAAEANKALVAAFLERFRLKPAEMQIVKTEPISDEFLDVMGRVASIQVESKKLLRIHHKTALMDIVDETASLQETGFDRLYRWLQGQLSAIEGDISDVPPLVRRGIKTLRSRDALFSVCMEDLSSSRKQTILKKFMTALTRGGPGGTPKPIEIHAHDPLRYVGDMMAWIHQALASERELLTSLLAAAEGDSPQPQSKKMDADKVLSAIFEGVAGTAQSRIQSVLQGQSSSVTIFKVGNLLPFYLHTIGGMLPEGSPLTISLQACHKLAGRLFMESLAQSAQKLYKHPPPCPPTLAPHPEVLGVLEELLEVMSSFDGSLIPARMREGYFKPVVEEGIGPIISGCALAANSIAPAEGSIYLVNCLLAVQTLLQRFDFCAWRLPQLHTQLTQALEQAVKEQVVAVMRSYNLDEKMYTLRAFKAGGKTDERLSTQAGMDPLSLNVALKQFYGAVLTSAVDFRFVEKITNHSARHQAKVQAAKGVTQSYKELYEAIMDKEGGYRDPQTLLLHTPSQIESLLVDTM